MKLPPAPIALVIGLQFFAGISLAEQPAAPAAPTADAAAPGAQNCIPLHRIRGTKVLDDRTILFEMSGNQTLVNHLPRRCPGLGFEKSFGYQTSMSQLCSQDIIRVLTHVGGRLDRGASCGLGKFEPYVAPVAEDAVKDKGKLEPM